MALARYLVVGSCRINGVEPGGVVDLDDQAVNVNVLLTAGHVKLAPEPVEDDASPPPAKKATKAATAKKGGG